MRSKIIFALVGLFLVIFQPRAFSGAALAQSSDQILYAAGRSGAHQIYVMDANGSNPRSVTSGGDNTEPRWSPDHQTIAFTRTINGVGEICVINPDGRGENVLRSDAHSPSWSPDGRQIVFISERGSSAQLAIMNADGSGIQILTSDPDSQASAPAWNPTDQTTIAFVYNQGGPSAIWLINADGSNLRALTHDDPNGSDLGTAWSPDGQQIAYVSTVGSDSTIRIVDARGGNPTPVANLNGKYADSLTWSPDGSKLVFASWRRGSPQAIFIVTTDGMSDLQQLMGGPTDAGWPFWSRVTASGGAAGTTTEPGAVIPPGVGTWSLHWDRASVPCTGTTIAYADFTSAVAQSPDGFSLTRTLADGTTVSYEQTTPGEYRLARAYTDNSASIRADKLTVLSPDMIQGQRTDWFMSRGCSVTVTYILRRN